MNAGDICKNCGGERGLHHYETSQCPVGGREAPIGRKQEWKTSTFEVEDNSAARIAALEAERDELRRSLNIMTELTALKYGNLEADIWAEIERARAVLAEVQSG